MNNSTKKRIMLRYYSHNYIIKKLSLAPRRLKRFKILLYLVLPRTSGKCIVLLHQLHGIDSRSRSRTEIDCQVISLVLYIFRNMLLLKDPPRASSSLSSSSTSLSSLQSRLLVSLRDTGLLELFLTCASNADAPEFSEFSAILLEISYLIVRGVGVQDVVRIREKAKAAKNIAGGGMLGDGEDEQLKALLEHEKRQRQMNKRGAPTRHSRFGTTITLKTVCPSHTFASFEL